MDKKYNYEAEMPKQTIQSLGEETRLPIEEQLKMQQRTINEMRKAIRELQSMIVDHSHRADGRVAVPPQLMII